MMTEAKPRISSPAVGFCVMAMFPAPKEKGQSEDIPAQQSALVSPTGVIIIQQMSFISSLYMGGRLSPAPSAKPGMLCADVCAMRGIQ